MNTSTFVYQTWRLALALHPFCFMLLLKTLTGSAEMPFFLFLLVLLLGILFSIPALIFSFWWFNIIRHGTGCFPLAMMLWLAGVATSILATMWTIQFLTFGEGRQTVFINISLPGILAATLAGYKQFRQLIK